MFRSKLLENNWDIFLPSNVNSPLQIDKNVSLGTKMTSMNCILQRRMRKLKWAEIFT